MARFTCPPFLVARRPSPLLSSVIGTFATGVVGLYHYDSPDVLRVDHLVTGKCMLKTYPAGNRKACRHAGQRGRLETVKTVVADNMWTSINTFSFRHTAAGPAKGGVHTFYDISHKLGEGSFATVTNAILRATGQWFTIKMIHESKVQRVTADETKSDGGNKTENAFMREIAIVEVLDHPNIRKLKEVFRNHGNIWFVYSDYFRKVSHRRSFGSGPQVC